MGLVSSKAALRIPSQQADKVLSLRAAYHARRQSTGDHAEEHTI
jgi:hypothetical protein